MTIIRFIDAQNATETAAQAFSDAQDILRLTRRHMADKL